MYVIKVYDSGTVLNVFLFRYQGIRRKLFSEFIRERS